MESSFDSSIGHDHQSSLSDTIQLKLLWVLQDKELSLQKFSKVCNELKDLDGFCVFGNPGSTLRRSVQREREYLLKKPKYLQKALSQFISLPGPSASTPSPLRNNSKRASRLGLQTPSPFRSPLPTTTTMSQALSARRDDTDDDIPSVPLVFNKPWETGYGIVCLMCRDVTVDGRVVDRVRVIKPIFDLRDSQNYQARLSVHGNSIIADEPAAPHFLLDRDNVDKICTLIDTKKDSRGIVVGQVCQQTKSAYEVATLTAKTKPECRKQQVLYTLPDGVTCNNRFFNPDIKGNPPSDEYLLRTKFVLDTVVISKDANGNDIRSFLPFIVWEMAVDDQDDVERRTTADNVGADHLGDALLNLGIARGTI